MVDSGAFVVESHSRAHLRLPELSTAAQREEMTASGRALRERLNVPVHFFAYPFGSSTWWTQLLAREAGYRGAVSVAPRGPYRFAVPRMSIRRGATREFAEGLARAWGEIPPS
jgi:peptidoglycan/xylan/chitin deacetylase (PgdA/CDA1 family)